jgi:D-serine deaminase-like pyridoxal phosphate-dependent protein
MTMNNVWYQVEDIDKLDSPVLVVFPERIKANINTAVGMVGNIGQLRPHVKTNKSAAATQLMLDAGVTKFKCATIAEAEMLGMLKAPDVVLAINHSVPNFNALLNW